MMQLSKIEAFYLGASCCHNTVTGAAPVCSPVGEAVTAASARGNNPSNTRAQQGEGTGIPRQALLHLAF